MVEAAAKALEDGKLGDKELQDMANIIQQRSEHVYATTSDHPRARPPQQVAEAFADPSWAGQAAVYDDSHAALTAAGEQATAGDVILVLGSLSLAADARRFLSDPPETTIVRRAEDPTV